MPEFIPRPQLPIGLAEQAIDLKSRSGDPWANLAMSLGQDVKSGVKDYKARQANAALTTEQQAAIKSGNYKGLNRGQQLPFLEKDREETARQADIKAKQELPVDADVVKLAAEHGVTIDPAKTPSITHQQYKAWTDQSIANSKNNVEVTDTVRDLMNQAGISVDPDAKTVSKADHDAALKIILSKNASESKEKTAKTAADSREKAAKTKAESDKSLAAGKQEAQKNLQKLKAGQISQENYNKAKEKNPLYYQGLEAVGLAPKPSVGTGGYSHLSDEDLLSGK